VRRVSFYRRGLISYASFFNRTTRRYTGARSTGETDKEAARLQVARWEPATDRPPPLLRHGDVGADLLEAVFRRAQTRGDPQDRPEGLLPSGWTRKRGYRARPSTTFWPRAACRCGGLSRTSTASDRSQKPRRRHHRKPVRQALKDAERPAFDRSGEVRADR
jgi:hypothetical protein